MSSYDANKIEEYQVVLLKNPRSKVFAALAEAYRKMGMHEEALETTQKGLQHNPDYVSGLVAQARVLYDMKKFADAIPCLQQALVQKPENLLALRLLAHCHIKQKQQSEALKAYKALLFYNPNDEKAEQFVKKWEFIEARNFEFSEPLLEPDQVEEWVEGLPSPAEVLTVVDAYITRENYRGAMAILKVGGKRWPLNNDIQRRQELLIERMPEDPILSVRRAFWEGILQRVEQRKNIDPLA